MCDLEWGSARKDATNLGRAGTDWAIITEFSLPSPDRFVRDITTFVPDGDGSWRRDSEHHENVLHRHRSPPPPARRAWHRRPRQLLVRLRDVAGRAARGYRPPARAGSSCVAGRHGAKTASALGAATVSWSGSLDRRQTAQVGVRSRAWEHGAVRAVSVTSCDFDGVLERGEFRHAAFDLTDRLGASVIGATVYEMQAGAKCWPYHYHQGVEEWLYIVVSGAPVLRDPNGERALEPGDLVAFPSGPVGAHTVHGPGRIVMFSTGARGWGEAFVTVYPDSDKIGAAPGVKFRRADAIDAWSRDAGKKPEPVSEARGAASELGGPTVNLMGIRAESPSDDEPRDGSRARRVQLGPLLGTQTWTATLYELAPGEATAAYHYEWCREEAPWPACAPARMPAMPSVPVLERSSSV